ncbi:MAG: hypothetical protein UZ22_OP11002000827 [Microgenomates bacterium OLB23]|nr:MAG: hypothetical protein UZ22_OP11002000827 [Microgenomates bacterium OLB23]
MHLNDFRGFFYRVVEGNDIKAAKEFLQYIKGTQLYSSQYAYLNAKFNNGLAAESIALEEKSIATKEYYRSLLQKNPKSRDALVILALYELRAGNKTEAARYYTQAKEIDPWLNIESLE